MLLNLGPIEHYLNFGSGFHFAISGNLCITIDIFIHQRMLILQLIVLNKPT